MFTGPGRWLRLPLFKALAVGIICQLGITGFSQDVDSLDQYEVDPVVVTGTRLALPKNRLPASISVVSRKEIELSGSSNVLPLVANQVPGLFLNDRGLVGYGVGPASGGNLSIRGISGSPNNRVLVLIDGQPQFMGIFAHPIADAYTSSDIERVEVIRGGASLLYGSNALAGAINFITRKTHGDGTHLGASLSYGSFETQLYNAHLRHQQGKFSLVAAGNYQSTTGIREDAPDDYNNLTGYLKLGYQVHENLSLSVDANLIDAEYGFPGPVSMPVDAQRDYTRGRVALALENEFDQWEGALRFYYNFGEHDFTDGFNSTDFTRGISLYQNWKMSSQTLLTLGAEVQQFGGTANNETLPPPVQKGLGTENTVEEVHAYALFQHTFSEKLTFNAGLRGLNNSIYGSAANPLLGFSYLAGKHSTLKASAARSFRSPGIIDLFIFPPSNADLEPESLWTYEVGWSQFFPSARLNLELTAFLMEGENLIQEVFTGTPPPQRQNTGSFSNRGLELMAQLQPSKRIFLGLNYTHLNRSTPMLYAPKHEANLQTRVQFPILSASVNLKWVDGLNTQLNPILEESYALLRLRLETVPVGPFRFFVEGDNLLDTVYEIDAGFPTPGRSFRIGIRLNTRLGGNS